MSVGERSRNATDEIVVQIEDTTTGVLLKPAYIDYRPRITQTAFDDRRFVAPESESWPHVAAKALGDPTAWWVIADLSGVIDPFDEPPSGNGPKRTIRVSPSPERYNLDILSGARPDR